MLTALFVLLLAPSAHAIPESAFGPASALLDNANGFFASSTFPGVGDLPISFTSFGSHVAGPRGCLVLVPGQGEPALKYVEVAHDLAAEGFAPIYAIDHRGQGFSGRMLPDPQKNTVNDFADYVTDFQTFVDTVVTKDPLCATPSLLAHSMGGTVVAAYLERVGDASPFHRVVMSSPMMRILYPDSRTEDSVITETFFACYTPFGPRCDDYAPGQGPLDLDSPLSASIVTHSQARHDLKIETYRRFPSIMVGGPTVRWVRQSALADREIRRHQNARNIAANVLMLEAGDDRLVNRASEEEFCHAMGNSCQSVVYPGAFHELFMEVDAVRDDALARAAAFFGQ